MPVTGVPAFDAVTILEMERVSFLTRDVALVAHGAFINTKTGTTYGSTSCRRWSTRTLDLLRELRESMEQDLAAMVFEGEGSRATARAAPAPVGIREHAETEADVPPI